MEQHQQFDEKDDQEDRVPLLALMTEYLAITYKHLQQQQRNQQQQKQYSAHEQQPISDTQVETAATASSASRRVLTKKTEPAGNGGLDNEDRNLIVRARDILGDDSSSSSRATSGSGSGPPPRYIVLDLLGQGTFGQVFRCQHMYTKQIVAVKVIRNHPSYYKQAIVEVQITRKLNHHYGPENSQHIVRLLDSFEFQNHLCLVFELLSINLYELISENNFSGFPIEVTRGFLRQILYALAQLADAGVVHCDLKPENILLAGQDQWYEDPISSNSQFYNQHSSPSAAIPLLKVVDFGSACLENETVYSYIQSRFYRSPEVLLGIPYNGAIDMWSLGCIGFEMLLGLPLFPGVSEHDQLCLIEETLGSLPQYLLKKGRNVLKFYDVRIRQSVAGFSSNEEFVLKMPAQFAKESNCEVRVAKKYFKFSKLEDLVNAYPFRENATPEELAFEQERRQAFLHFLNGLLVVDPAARWTAREALRHPFITGERFFYDESPPPVASRLDLPDERCGSLLGARNDSVSYCYQQQQQQQIGLSGTLMDQYQQQQQSVPVPAHQRVCPVNAYYSNSMDPYYSGEPASVYAYDQPWTPAYTAFSMGNAGNYAYDYRNSVQQQAPYAYSSQLQPQFDRNVPLYEPFEPSVTRMKQKVIPVPQTGSVVMPMYSPVYSFQRLEFPYQQQMPFAYDPSSFMLPLDRQQYPISVAPMDHQFKTPPKPHHHSSHHHNHHHHHQSGHKAVAAHRTTRRKRSTQPRISDSGLSLPNFGPPIYANDTNTGINDRSDRLTTSVGLAKGFSNHQHHHHRQQKNKRRSENESESGSEQEQRPWKSPKSTSHDTTEVRNEREIPPTREFGADETEPKLRENIGAQWTPSDEVNPRNEMYFVDGGFDSAIQCSMATPAPPLPT